MKTRSVTRATFTLERTYRSTAGAGVKLTYTEHGAYLDGHDNPKQRQDGTAWILDNLRNFLENQ